MRRFDKEMYAKLYTTNSCEESNIIEQAIAESHGYCLFDDLCYDSHERMIASLNSRGISEVELFI